AAVCQLHNSSMSRSALLVGVHHIDSDAATTDSGDQRAQRGRGTPATADHLAEVVGVDVHLDRSAPPAGDQVDSHFVGVVDNPADQMLDGVDDDSTHGRRQLSGAASAGCACSAPSAAAASTGWASSAGLAAASAFSAVSPLSAAAAF